MKRFLLAVLFVAAAIAGAYLLFAAILLVRYACDEGYRELEFSGVEIPATAQMRPRLIESKKDIPTPIYISVKGKSLKLDPETTREETKTFFDDIGLDYEERLDQSEYRSWGEVYFSISAGCFWLEYHHDKLSRYSISLDRNDRKMMDGLSIGTSPQALFPLTLRFADIEAMFGRNYKVHKRPYK
ncbi:MAG: hypothetical protein J5806_13435 [Lentisphaeria bacterium]|nr:hypothetical protein [Lentisphaeria bacterium]